MSQGNDHVEEKILPCLDGELSPAEAEAVRAHCRTCEACGQAYADMEALVGRLDADRDTAACTPLWPLISERLASRREPIFRLRFSLAAGAAALAGLFAGILLDTSPSPSPTWQQETWTEVGTLLTEQPNTTLDSIYLSAIENGENGS